MNLNTRPGRMTLRCDPLEARDTPAGNVTAFVSYGWAGDYDLTVTGDGDPAGNQVSVAQGPDGIYVYGLNGTTVNGQPSAFVGTGRPDRVSIQLTGKGPDFAEVSNLSAGSVDVSTGGGDDAVFIHDVSVGAVYVDGGAGNDRVELRNVSTQFGGAVSGGDGFDTLYYGGVSGPPSYQQFEQEFPTD